MPAVKAVRLGDGGEENRFARAKFLVRIPASRRLGAAVSAKDNATRVDSDSAARLGRARKVH